MGSTPPSGTPEEKEKEGGIAEVVAGLGLGLSQLLRYSYGGFLLVGLYSVLDHRTAQEAREAMGWQLTAITALVVGAGLYAIHRTVIIPIHHPLPLLSGGSSSRVGAFRGSALPTRHGG